MESHVQALIRKSDDRPKKIAFLSAVVIGLLVHMYKFTNTLLITDSLSNFYASQNILGSGRWFLEIACAPSTFFDLPWITGLFSLFWIAAATVIIADLFRMEKTVQIILTGGLMAVFPAVTEIFFYQYTADGYMFAMFLAALSVRLTTVGQKKIRYWIAAAICLTCACGIYQTYVSFALILMIAYLITILLDGKHKGKTCLLWCVAQAGMYAVSMVLYVVIWKVCMAIQHVQPTDYQGINSLGSIKMSDLIVALKTSFVQTLDFFLNGLLTGNRTVNVWLVLHVLFLVGLIAIVAAGFLRLRVYRDKLRTVLLAAAILAIPVASGIWLFSSKDVSYLGMRMKHCYCVLYILGAVLFERYARLQWKNVFALLLTAVLFSHALTANILYFSMQQYSVKSLSTATEIVTRIHEVDSGKAKYLVVVGTERDSLSSKYINKTRLGGYYGRSLNSLLRDETGTALYLANCLDFSLRYYVDHPKQQPQFAASQTTADGKMNSRFSLMGNEERNALIASDAVRQMSDWPAAGSVAEIGDAIVLKYSDETPAT